MIMMMTSRLLPFLLFLPAVISAFTEVKEEDILNGGADSPINNCRHLFIGMESLYHPPKRDSMHKDYHDTLFTRPLNGRLVFDLATGGGGDKCALVISGNADYDGVVEQSYRSSFRQDQGWQMLLLREGNGHEGQRPRAKLVELLFAVSRRDGARAAENSLVLKLNLESDAEGGGSLAPLKAATALGALCGTRAVTLEYNTGVVCNECGVGRRTSWAAGLRCCLRPNLFPFPEF